MSEFKADDAEHGDAEALARLEDDQESESGISESSRIRLDLRPGETRDRGVVRLLVTPALQAALSIQSLTAVSGGTVDTNELVGELEDQLDQLNSGETDRAESILCSQAHTLDALFNSLLRRALANVTEGYFEAGQKYLRLALRAQSQCRATVDCLVGIGQPVIRQTNIAHGHQQVNNYCDENPPNELLEEKHSERLEAGKTEKASETNPQLEPMGEIHRAKVGRR